MQIKNKKILITICSLYLFLFNVNLSAEEFDIKAKEINIDRENEVIIGKGSVQAKDSDGKNIFLSDFKLELDDNIFSLADKTSGLLSNKLEDI